MTSKVPVPRVTVAFLLGTNMRLLCFSTTSALSLYAILYGRASYLAFLAYSPVFHHLPEPNRACLVGVYAFLIWDNLCDLVYQTPTESYQSQIPVAFGKPGHVTTKHLPDTPC